MMEFGNTKDVSVGHICERGWLGSWGRVSGVRGNKGYALCLSSCIGNEVSPFSGV